MRFFLRLSLLGPVLLGVLLQLRLTPLHKGATELPQHLLHHEVLSVPDMLDKETNADLLALVKQLATYPVSRAFDVLITEPVVAPPCPPLALPLSQFSDQHRRGRQERLVLVPTARAHRRGGGGCQPILRASVPGAVGGWLAVCAAGTR